MPHKNTPSQLTFVSISSFYHTDTSCETGFLLYSPLLNHPEETLKKGTPGETTLGGLVTLPSPPLSPASSTSSASDSDYAVPADEGEEEEKQEEDEGIIYEELEVYDDEDGDGFTPEAFFEGLAKAVGLEASSEESEVASDDISEVAYFHTRSSAPSPVLNPFPYEEAEEPFDFYSKIRPGLVRVGADGEVEDDVDRRSSVLYELLKNRGHAPSDSSYYSQATHDSDEDRGEDEPLGQPSKKLGRRNAIKLPKVVMELNALTPRERWTMLKNF